ncbi:autotransporter outer membrane beta-barrel domain-containing protein [Sporomusa aerivorans]|uniref:autotransporter outer membrane beta-barrel domain-containing protein n=1 Tax=Sporomusa aerivorans TaxID=204936 RepID=UPI00352AF448
MKRKKFTRKTRNLALVVAVALGCSVSPWGLALAAEQAETAEQFAISISGDKEQADPTLPYFQNRNLLATLAAAGSSPGFVTMAKDSADITIDKYTGTSGVYVYTHDAANPKTIYGGKITIVSADKDANGKNAFVRLRTDSSGIDLVKDDSVVLGVLNALAQKLTYSNYASESNLSGYAEIAEGLTQGSFVKKQGDLFFDWETGQGTVYYFNSFNKVNAVLTGDEAKDTDYKDYIQKDPANPDPFRKVIYNFKGSTTIAPAVTSTATGGNFAAIMPAAGKEFFVTSGGSSNQSLTLDLTGIKTNGGKVYGIYNDQAAAVKVYGYGGLNIIGTTDGTYAGGIFAGNANGTGTSAVEIDEIYNDNSLNISGGGQNFAGIKAVKNGVINSNTWVNIVTDGGYGVVAENGGVVNFNKADTKSIINTNGKVALYAKDGGKITFLGAKTINGDAVAEGEGSSIDLAVGSGSWIGNAVGHVNVKLNNMSEGWKGNFDSDGTLAITAAKWEGNAARDKANVLLLDRAIWNGVMEKTGNLTLMGRSNWVNTGNKATILQSFSGANIDGLKGSITSAADLTIDKYSGQAAVYFTHDAANPTNIQGGKVTIKSADKDAAITLRTDNSGIDLTNDTVVKNVLNSMAQKLTYSAYVTGENNLDGYAEIAEGLTAGSLAQKIGTIRFDKTTGAGSVADAGLKPFNAVITGDSTKDKAFADRGVLTVAGNTSTYSFTQDTIINNTINVEGATPDPTNMKYAVAINPDANKHVVLNMNGHDLIIRNNIGQGQMAQSTSAVIYALNSDTSVTINNPGAIDLSTFSQAYYAGGISAGSRFATDAKACEVIINNDNSWEHAVKIRGVMGMGGVSSDSIFNINWTGMKVFDHGHIDIKGLVDIESYGAWGLSAIGSDGYINVGGGRIVSKDYSALDSYNNGTVNVNVSGSGNSLQAGNHDVVIEGNLRATGQWVGAGSGGNINVALVNKNSYLIGLADNPAGGTVNLFLKNGATWTNRDGGFRYGNNSVFDDNGKSLVTHFYGGDSEANRGIIIQKQTGKIMLANYQGHALAYYEHDAADPIKIIGGDLEITSAVKNGGDNAVISLRTDNSGINVNDKDLVTKVLDNLASKLSYTNYLTGERNLTGYAEIAEGLTSSKVVRQEKIIFDDNSGAGRISAEPLGQIVTKFTSSLTGDSAVDEQYRKAGTIINNKYVFEKATVIAIGENSAKGGYAYNATGIQAYTPVAGNNEGPYKQVTIEAKNGLKIDGTKANTSNAGIYSGNGSALTVNGNIGMELISKPSYGTTVGILQDLQNWQAGAKATITINGNVAMDIKQERADDAVIQPLTPRTEYVVGILNRESNGSEININGLLDLTVNGTGVMADSPTDATGVINLKGGRIITNENQDINNHALTAYSGTINLNMNPAPAAKTMAAVALTPGNTKVEVEGNILTMKNTATSATSNNLLDGTVNMALTTGESYWKGVADNAGADKLGTFNLYLKNGALWINDSQGKTYNQTNAGVLQGVFDNISHVTSFTGGDSDATRGIIQQKSNTGIAIDNYSGNTMVIYGHNSQNPAEIIGGGLRIEKAATGSAITLMTDSSGINVAEENTVNEVLNALAGKLTYDGYQTAKANLTGKVAIGEGLTAPGILWKVGDIEFNSATGSLASGSVITPDNPIEYGQYETMVMSGAKSAMVSSAMLWRTENNDLQKRLGELRLSPENGGIWANVYGGKSKYDQNNTRYSTSYKAVQIGYDKEVNSGWRVGAAVSHTDGDSDYILGGRGDNTATSLSLYGSWQGDKGHYSDIVLKGGQIKNDFTVYNEMGHKVEGDYKTNGLSVSAEYGRRIEYGKGLYVEPQMQLSWGRLQGKDYTATSDVKDGAGNYRTMNISQDGFTSLVGRIGVGVGRLTEKSSIYAKAFLAHEFSGDFSSRFIAEEAKKSRVDLGGSWAVFQLGGSTKVSNNAYAYANLEKSVGGDVATEWRLDAGMRWSF